MNRVIRAHADFLNSSVITIMTAALASNTPGGDEVLNEAHEQIRQYVRTTPLLRSDYLSRLIHGEVLVKAESLQVTGAFKYRGALYRLLNLPDRQKKQGVIAYSSGNFAAGLAAAGQLLDIPVQLVMPHDAPAKKIRNAEYYQASVTLCQHCEPSREEAASNMANTIARNSGTKLLHPFDDHKIIIGQASVALELLEQLEQLQKRCDHLLCPVGGGSLVAGSSLALHRQAQVWAVEADGYQGMNLSLQRGERSRAPGNLPCECDALMAMEPGVANLEVTMQTGVKGVTVNAEQVHSAVQLAFNELHLVLEPSGAVGLAAIMKSPELFYGKTVVIIASGGNVDQKKYAALLA